ncbi:uncharacterized protein dbf4b [Pholidichthys leucotaenia]
MYSDCKVESFLHKDVNFVVTGSQEVLKEEKSLVVKGGPKGTSEKLQQSKKQATSSVCNDKPHQETPRPMACGSRGKALLEKAIRNNERLQGSSVLSSAQSWGVKILHVDEVLRYLKQLTRESFSAKHKRSEKTDSKHQVSSTVKAFPLRSPYLKIEDLSKKYKPLHMQSMTFPDLCYSGRYSPFESLPPRIEKQSKQEKSKTRKNKIESSIVDKPKTLLNCNPSPWRPRKKDYSYCECCRLSFSHLEEHLQSDLHRSFALDSSNYILVDQLVADMFQKFDPSPPEQSEDLLSRSTTLFTHDVCELEPLTDVETELAVQALREPVSAFHTHISSPPRGPLSLGPDSLSPRVNCATPNPANPPADNESLNPGTQCQLSHASVPTMPVLNIEPQAQDSLSQITEVQILSSCPLSDPFLMPPVLSPQVPYSYVTNPDGPFSDPPVLSPQQYITEDTVEGQICERIPVESVSKASFFTPCPMSEFVAHEVEMKGSSQDGLGGFSELMSFNRGMDQATTSSRRSHSLPRQSSVEPNTRKRSRSASPEYSQCKRRRTLTFVCSDSKTKQMPTKPLSNNVANVEDYLFFDKDLYHVKQSSHNSNISSASSVCNVDTLVSKRPLTALYFPTAQNFTPAPDQMHSVASGLLWSNTTPCNPPLNFPIDKPHNIFSIQDSQYPHSTSVFIESALIPNLSRQSPSSDSDWDCDLLSQLGPTSVATLTQTEQNCELDKELLRKPCPWMHGSTSYESHLRNVLQPSPSAAALCGEEIDPSTFSRTVFQIVEVQH